jgi:hypothetical protein
MVPTIEYYNNTNNSVNKKCPRWLVPNYNSYPYLVFLYVYGAITPALFIKISIYGILSFLNSSTHYFTDSRSDKSNFIIKALLILFYNINTHLYQSC